MDNPNPIYYHDLIKPDDSITDLIKQLDDLINKYEAAKSKIQGAAAEAAKSMSNLSGATEEQREQITLLTAESDKLAASYRKSNDLESETFRRRQQVIQAVKEQQRIDKLVVELNNAKEGSYNRLSAQYRLNKIRLNEMSQAEREGTKAGRELEKETRAIYERMNELQKATGKSQLQVGQYERAWGNFLGVNGRVVSALTDTKQAAATLGGVFKALASPIGIAIGAIGGVVAAFKLFKESIQATQTTGDAFDYAMGGWTGTWEVFKKAVSTVDFTGFIRGARDAAEAGENLKMVLDETFERTNSSRILRASMSEENAILQETMRDTRKSYAERLAAADQYLANMKPIYEQETETAKRTRDAQLEYLFSVTNRREFATKEEREAAKERLATYIRDYNLNEDNIKLAQKYLQAQKDVSTAEKEMQKAGTVRMNEYYAQQRKTSQAIVDGANDQIKAIANILSQYNLASNEQIQAYVNSEESYLNAKSAAYNDQKRIVTMRNTLEAQQTKEAQEQAKARKKAAEDEAKAEAKAAEDAAKATENAKKEEIANQRAILNASLQSIQLQIAATESGTQEMLDLRIKMFEKQRDIELFENAQKAEQLRQDEQKIKDKYDAMIMRETANFNVKLAERDLAAQQKLMSAEMDLTVQNERQKTQYRLEMEQARLEAILKINESATEKMTDEEIKAIKKTIDAIKVQAKSLPYNNLYELLGISMDSQQQKELDTAISSTTNSIGKIIDAWNAAADAAVNAADKQVEAAQKALDAEIEARNAGYANSVEDARKRLALEQSNQQKALVVRQRAQRAQLALDSIEQASSLITATANIWQAFTKVGGVAGPVLAGIATASMWGSFLAAKIQAFAATATETYGEGTVELLQGGSHASGHDIDLGTKPDGTRRRAEGGEYFAVINKRNSRRFRDVIPDVINSFNDGTFADRYQRANAAMAGYAVQMIGGGVTDVSGLEKDVAAIRQQGDETRFVDGQGNTIIRYKNLTRKIKS